jgi:TolA-binding protein
VIDAEVAAQLMGPLGGAIGLGMMMGAALMFAANRKVVEPYKDRAHTAEIQALQAQIALMQRQIGELEQFRDNYMELLQRHSKATLNP